MSSRIYELTGDQHSYIHWFLENRLEDIGDREPGEWVHGDTDYFDIDDPLFDYTPEQIDAYYAEEARKLHVLITTMLLKPGYTARAKWHGDWFDGTVAEEKWNGGARLVLMDGDTVLGDLTGTSGPTEVRLTGGYKKR
jgi:hypothetical protein